VTATATLITTMTVVVMTVLAVIAVMTAVVYLVTATATLLTAVTAVVINVIAAAVVVFAEAVGKTHGPNIYKDTKPSVPLTFSFAQLAKGKSLGCSKPATKSQIQAPQHTVWIIFTISKPY
jgi:hypothetical protein